MISDAYVLATCDWPSCRKTVEIELEFNYPDYSGYGGRYDHRPEQVVPRIRDAGWIVGGDLSAEPEGKHYCSEECADIAEPDTESTDEPSHLSTVEED